MSGTGRFSSASSNFNGEPAPFSDINIPPSDYGTSVYLEPTSSRPNSSQQSGKVPTQHDSGVIDDLPPDFNGSTSSNSSKLGTSSLHARNSPGVVDNILDLHQSPPPRSSTRLDNIPETDMPFRMKRPDSLMPEGHEYQELPTSRLEAGGNYSEVDSDQQNHVSLASSGRSLPPMLHKLHTSQPMQSTDSNDNLLTSSLPQMPAYRKRQNPLYDSSEHEDERNVKIHGQNNSDSGKCFCLWWTILVITLIFSLAGLCLSLYNFTYYHEEKARESDNIKTAMVISPHNRTFQDVMLRLQALEEQNQQLMNKIMILEKNVSATETKEIVVHLQDEMMSFKSNFTLRFNDLSTQLDFIELSEGPQGPPGVGNLSGCEHKHRSAGDAGSAEFTDSPFVPNNLAEHQKIVILGVECITEGGLYSRLTAEKHIDTNRSPETEYERFKCKCSGKEDGSQSRFCEIHYWQCPRVS